MNKNITINTNRYRLKIYKHSASYKKQLKTKLKKITSQIMQCRNDSYHAYFNHNDNNINIFYGP